MSVQSAPYPRIAVCHMCRCVSIMPGMTMPPDASISAVPSGTSSPGPTAAIVSPVTSTSAPVSTVCAASMVSTVALRNTTGRPGEKSAAVRSGAVMPGLRSARSAALRTSVRYPPTRREPDVKRGSAGRTGADPAGRVSDAAGPLVPGQMARACNHADLGAGQQGRGLLALRDRDRAALAEHEHRRRGDLLQAAAEPRLQVADDRAERALVAGQRDPQAVGHGRGGGGLGEVAGPQ